MADHLIQLRRAWKAELDGSSSRLDLPTVWDDGPIPEKIARRFNRPPLDTTREVLLLRFDAVAGLRSVFLNGIAWKSPPGGGDVWEIPLAEIAPSGNLLVLTLDVGLIPRGIEWGRIGLVVRS